MENPLDITIEEFNKATCGLIPWTASGLSEAIALASMLDAVEDDDLPKELVEFATSPEWQQMMKEIEAPDALEAAKAMLLMSKYADDGNLAAFACHMRFTQTSLFLEENFDELIKIGLIEESPKEGGAVLSDGLLEALAVLPFSDTRVEQGEVVRRFSLAEVIAKARAENQGKARNLGDRR
jgi:hypothetical protein